MNKSARFIFAIILGIIACGLSLLIIRNHNAKHGNGNGDNMRIISESNKNNISGKETESDKIIKATSGNERMRRPAETAVHDSNILPTNQKEDKIKNEPEIECAVKYLGENMASNKNVIIGEYNDNDDVGIPFLNNRFKGRPMYVAKVKLNGLCIDDGRNKYRNDNIQEVRILITKDTKQIVRIEAGSSDGGERMTGQVTLKEAEEWLQSLCWKYCDLPEKGPKLSFQEVLNQLYKIQGAQIEPAKRITAIFVDKGSTRKDRKDIIMPIWILHLQGIRPMPGHGFETESIDYFSYLLDDDGKEIESNNMPVTDPVLWRKENK